MIDVVLVVVATTLLPMARIAADRCHPTPSFHLASHIAATAPLVVAFIVPPGSWSAALVIPWVMLATTDAIRAMLSIMSQRTVTTLVAIDTARVWWAVGAMWMLAHRGEWQLFGYAPTIVSLTAAHFHVAGVLLPITTALATVRSGYRAWVPLATALGVPLTALGIQLGGWTETITATLMSLAGLAAAVVFILHDNPAVRGGGIGLTVGMLFALSWAWGVQIDQPPLDIDQMVRYHGALNTISVGVLVLGGVFFGHASWPKIGSVSLIRFGRWQPQQLEQFRRAAQQMPVDNTPSRLHNAPASQLIRSERKSTANRDQLIAAMRAWQGHQRAKITVYPTDAPIIAGQIVAISIPVGPLSIAATARIIETVDTVDRFGFTYRALDIHPEVGDEEFIIERDETAWKVVATALATHAILAARLAPPITLWLQHRALRRYLKGIANPENNPQKYTRQDRR